MAQPNPPIAAAQGEPHEFLRRAAETLLACVPLLSKLTQSTPAVRLKAFILAMIIILYLKLAALPIAIKVVAVLAIVGLAVRNHATARAATADPAPLFKSLHGIAHMMPIDEEDD